MLAFDGLQTMAIIKLTCFLLEECCVDQGHIQPVWLGGGFSILGSKSHNGFATVREMKYIHYTTVCKQWTTGWPYVANAVFRMVKNHGERNF